MKILAIGAAGEYAGMIIPELKKRGHEVTAFIRNESKSQSVLDRGADEIALGDLTDLKSLTQAAEAKDAIFGIIPAFKDELLSGLNMIKAAESAGIKKFIFSSVYHPSLSLVNHITKRPIEEALYKSGVNYTILQPAMFMQVLQPAMKSVTEKRLINGPYSKTAKISFVNYQEVAEVAAIAMDDDRLAYGTFELASHGMYSREDIAIILSDILKLKITAVETSSHEAVESMKLPKGISEAMEAMFNEYDRYGFSGGNSLILETILRREPCSIEKYLKAFFSIK